MASSEQLKIRVDRSLKLRIARDSNATNRSMQTIVEKALRVFYDLPIPQREALILRAPAMKAGRRTA